MQLGIIILILFLIMQVPFSRSSLNHDDVFVLDTELKIYQFNGATSNIQERAKALDVVQCIKDKYHEGKCEVAVIEDCLIKGMWESNKCYLLDCGSEIYIWVGRVTQLEDRKAASLAAEEFISSQKRPKYTHIVRVIQGFETLSFKANFESWPHGPGTAGSEEGKGKVACK
jgi:gelsolin